MLWIYVMDELIFSLMTDDPRPLSERTVAKGFHSPMMRSLLSVQQGAEPPPTWVDYSYFSSILSGTLYGRGIGARSFQRYGRGVFRPAYLRNLSGQGPQASHRTIEKKNQAHATTDLHLFNKGERLDGFKHSLRQAQPLGP
jgi:hypothetical protein